MRYDYFYKYKSKALRKVNKKPIQVVEGSDKPVALLSFTSACPTYRISIFSDFWLCLKWRNIIKGSDFNQHISLKNQRRKFKSGDKTTLNTYVGRYNVMVTFSLTRGSSLGGSNVANRHDLRCFIRQCHWPRIQIARNYSTSLIPSPINITSLRNTTIA